MFSSNEIREIIKNGETGQVEFKSEREKNIDLAKEVAAFANGAGGYLLVGIEDDGTVSGVSNPLKFEEKIYNICSDSIRPVVTPELWKYKIVEEQIFNLLSKSDKPLKTKEISAAIGLAKRTTINWINRLIDKNIVEPTSENRNDPNCRYRLRY